MEIRIKDVNLQLTNEDVLEIGGYINVTNRESEILYSAKKKKYFKEVMCSGVFERAIKQSKEIPLLFEHNWNKILATTKDNSLELFEDNIGLRFLAKINNKEVYDLVKQGVINSCSFGFRALKEKVETINPKLEKRFVDSINLLEVSLVKNPAYVGSLCETRSATEEQLEDLTKEVVEIDQEETQVEARESIEEATEEIVEDIQEEVTEKIEETQAKEVKEIDEKVVSRNFDNVNNLEPLISTKEIVTKEEVVEIVDELIAKKLMEVSKAEEEVQVVQQELGEVKEIHKEIEESISDECMRNNAEVIKLRLELLKLNNLKKGIKG